MVASTAPGQQAALASPNEAFVLVLSPTGRLSITERATGRVLMTSGTQSHCLPPFQLVLLPNGLLVLQDRRGSVLWTSGGACSGNSSCYSYALQNDGQLVVRDAGKALVWTSSSAAAAAAVGQMSQLISGDRTTVACLQSGPRPAARHLLSRLGQYKLQLLQQGARLQVVDTLAGGAELWSPQGALPGQPPARLCITPQGTLVLSAVEPELQQLWSSGLAASPAAGPYVAVLSDDSCLEVRDSRCRLVWNNHDGAVGSRGRGHAPPPRLARPGSSSSPPARTVAGARPPPRTVSIGRQARPPPRGPRAQPPPAKAAARLTPPPAKAAARLTPPPAAGVATLPAAPQPGSSPGRRPPPAPASAQLIKVPSKGARPPPDSGGQQVLESSGTGTGGGGSSSSSSSSSSSAAGPICLLHHGQPCGGISLCGSDGVCMHLGCCITGLACVRHSDFLWRCG